MAEHEDYSSLPGRRITSDQLIAINMRYWRRAAGITQQQFGQLCGWSKANVSAMETSAAEDGDPRRFDAQAILTIAWALEVPVTALMLPPDDDGVTVRYLWQPAPGQDWLPMANLFAYVMSEPPSPDESPLGKPYADRYRAAIRKYTELSDDDLYPGGLPSVEQRKAAAEDLREQRAVLARVLDDMDRRAEAILDAGDIG